MRATRREFIRGGAWLSAGLVGLCLAGCGGASSQTSPKPSASSVGLGQLVQAAKQEGRITYYSSQEPNTTAQLIQAFKEKYGIEVQPLRLASGALGQRYAAEAQAGNVVADVIQLSDTPFMEQATAKGWLAQLDTLPAAAQWPKQYWMGTFAKIMMEPIVIVWNTDQVRPGEKLAKWQDVLDPRWTGKILLVDPRAVPVVTAWAYLMRETYGDDFLRKLGAQNPRLVASSVPGTQQLGAGAAAILVPGLASGVLPLQKKGAPLAWALPDVTTGIENLAGVSAKAPHPNAARLLLNYLLTPEGQEVFVRASESGTSPLANIPGNKPLPLGYKTPQFKEAAVASEQLAALLGIH